MMSTKVMIDPVKITPRPWGTYAGPIRAGMEFTWEPGSGVENTLVVDSAGNEGITYHIKGAPEQFIVPIPAFRMLAIPSASVIMPPGTNVWRGNTKVLQAPTKQMKLTYHHTTSRWVVRFSRIGTDGNVETIYDIYATDTWAAIEPITSTPVVTNSSNSASLTSLLQVKDEIARSQKAGVVADPSDHGVDVNTETDWQVTLKVTLNGYGKPGDVVKRAQKNTQRVLDRAQIDTKSITVADVRPA